MQLDFLKDQNVIMLGAPFAGKTTFARQLSEQFGHTHIEIGKEVRKRFPDKTDAACLDYAAIEDIIKEQKDNQPYIIDKIQGWTQLFNHTLKNRTENEWVIIVRLAGPVELAQRHDRNDNELDMRIRNYYQMGFDSAEKHAFDFYKNKVKIVYRDHNGFFTS